MPQLPSPPPTPVAPNSISENILSAHPKRKVKKCLSSGFSNLLVASLLLVLTGFPKNSGCRSYSEALATSFYKHSSNTQTYLNRNVHSAANKNYIRDSNAIQSLRGGSLFTSSEDIEQEVVNGGGKVQKKSKKKGFQASATFTTGISIDKVNGEGPNEKAAIEGMSESDGPMATMHIAETNLPTDIGQFRLRAYRVNEDSQTLRNKYVGSEPCVIYSPRHPPFGESGVPVRIHDQCLTSEVFRSQRCDCKEQLKMALEYVEEHGGAIIYLQQEGRGIGLANKVAAYALQDVGMDTVDANTHLGFPEDCRQYGVVPSILEDLGIDSIKLMTNNPRKIDRLSALGLKIDDTIPMVVPTSNPFNRKYLQTKQDRMSHTNFGEMLSLPSKDSTEEVVQQAVTTLLQSGSSVAEEFINEGEEMAAAAISSALLVDTDQAGVTAADDGYCFGRESVEAAVAAVARGELVVVVDDMDRENEGDFIMSADLCTPETMATIVRYSSGVICIGMEGERMDELDLPAMMENNEDPKETAFSVTVDATREHGITTGISATDRAITMNVLANSKSTSIDLVRPGHIFPLRAKEGGTLTRDGHTEAAVDLSRLAGRHPSGVLCEIVSEENPTEMARLPELKRFCKKHGYVLTSIVDIAQYRRDTESPS
uniref:GTP cyclohydrolase II n=1 Tax=Chaetoceros debilis TaxID=122233 RepID=A0A7S3V819_9STRA|mmetsp:Transcript_20051/g.29485  ORF Transcript_20051/g.29485 Transcript_20051/m.29485 type:complete len:654 (-) Transcript_20051:62-2023(-)|eukprot:CAMPEP_0194074626 /NCGR_PEP_ID=MMETSP0149-20130528/1697_1 /TAXON_ID=122233 /ORGANISM="Chaetoceros debilis, Strain MM31A-1" /LENGTH=653 /DNA_ID=CAMNT_0038754855 /DNA_START=180 /DNA_END=2141 /DNA_ORIENTATION=-